MPDKEDLLTVRLPSDLHRHAKFVAAGRDETISQVVRRALRAYVASGPVQMDIEDAARPTPRPKKRG